MKKMITIAVIGLLAIGVVALVVELKHLGRSAPEGQFQPDAVVVRKLSHRMGSSADFSHLASDVRAPSSSWISGAVLQKDSQPVFASPLALQMSNHALRFGVPNVTVSSDEVSAPFSAEYGLGLQDKSWRLSYFDGVVAKFTIDQIGTLTISQGSPYVWLEATHDVALPLLGKMTPLSIRGKQAHFMGGYLTLSGHGALNVDAAQLRVGDTLAIGLLPTKNAEHTAFEKAAEHRIASATIDLKDGAETTTNITYRTVDGRAPYVMTPAYFANTGANDPSYQTLFGEAPIKTQSTIRYTTPWVAPSNKLAVVTLSDEQKTALKKQLVLDTAVTKIDTTDTYNTGKRLDRAANLLELANQLGDKKSAETLKRTLNAAFSARLTDKYFYYDDKLHGLAPTTDSFGAQDFNDHHFHYGYWVYAASILGRYDGTFVHRFGNWIDALAADYSSPTSTQNFNRSRVYDAYAGHSWAAGLSPFRDGNNQESSSEAVHAWNGAALWGELRHDDALTKRATAQLSVESYTAQKLWRTPALMTGYSAPLVDMVWGGKAVYHTWFSDNPSAKLGIQVIPADPSQQSIMRRDTAIETRVKQSVNDNFNSELGDWNLMYMALQNQNQARQKFETQTMIDPGNSKTYLMAWILTANK